MKRLLDFTPASAPESHITSRQPLPALPGEAVSFHVPKLLLAGNAPGTIRVDILTDCTDCGPGTPNQVVEQAAGLLAAFSAETTGQLAVRVNSLAENSQFTLRIGSAYPLGTFYVESANAAVELTRLVAQWQGVSGVTVTRQGNRLLVGLPRVYGGQAVKVELGRPRITNANSPDVTDLLKQANVSAPAKTRWRVSIGPGVQEGNVFHLGTVKYTAQRGDTAASVLKALAPSGLVAGSVAPLAYSEPGVKSVPNTNAPSLTLQLDKTENGLDYYTVLVGPDIREGNVYELTRTPDSAPTRVVVSNPGAKASATDLQLVTTLLLASFGRFNVPTGTRPQVQALRGTRQVANAYAPPVTLTVIDTTPARTVDEYYISVNLDVAAGNVFTLDGVTYTAREGDTALDVARALSGGEATSNPFVYQVAAGKSPRAIADQGTPPGVLAISGVAVETPTVQALNRATVRGWARVGCRSDVVRIGLRSAGGTLLAVSNPLWVDAGHARRSVELTYGAPVDAYGLEWGDGFTLRGRLWGEEVLLTPTVQETEAAAVGGQYDRQATSILTTHRLKVAPLHEDLHEAIAVALKHPTLFVGGRRRYARGEYTLSERKPATRRRSAQIDTLPQGESRSLLQTAPGAALFSPVLPYGLSLLLTSLATKTDLVLDAFSVPVLLTPGLYRAKLMTTAGAGAQLLKVSSTMTSDVVVRYAPPAYSEELGVMRFSAGEQLTAVGTGVPEGCQFVAAVSVDAYTCQTKVVLPTSGDFSPDFFNGTGNFYTGIAAGCNKTGWKVPTAITITGVGSVAYATYLAQYVPLGYPYFGPLYDPATCHC